GIDRLTGISDIGERISAIVVQLRPVEPSFACSFVMGNRVRRTTFNAQADAEVVVRLRVTRLKFQRPLVTRSGGYGTVRAPVRIAEATPAGGSVGCNGHAAWDAVRRIDEAIFLPQRQAEVAQSFGIPGPQADCFGVALASRVRPAEP